MENSPVPPIRDDTDGCLYPIVGGNINVDDLWDEVDELPLRSLWELVVVGGVRETRVGVLSFMGRGPHEVQSLEVPQFFDVVDHSEVAPEVKPAPAVLS